VTPLVPGPPPPAPDADLAQALAAGLPELTHHQQEVVGSFLSRLSVEAGALVAKEGDRDRDLLFVVQGDAKLVRSGLELDVLHPGSRVFDVCFATGMPRPASLIAMTRLTIARLPFDRFRLFSVSHPDVALALHEAVVTGLSRHLSSNDVARAPLVHDRSLPRRPEVSVRIHGIPRTVPTGTPARHLLPERMQGRLVVAALIDRKAVSLATPITSESELAALTTAHWEGQRVHRHSVALALLEAARRVDPRLVVEMGPSLGFAQRIIIRDAAAIDLPALAPKLEAAMHELAGEHALLREEWWTVDEAREHLSREGSAAASLLSTWRDPAVPLVSYGTVYALQMEPLLPDTGMLQGFRVLPADDVLLLVYGAEAAARPVGSSSFPAVQMPSTADPAAPLAASDDEGAYVAKHARRASAQAASLIVGQERWLATLGVSSVGAFNRACIDGQVTDLIRVGEGFHEKRIGAIADEIKERLGEVRIVCIAGPSSSGKTTFIRRLQVQLQVDGIRPVGLSLDDYYVDRALTPRDESGEYDYEALEALRLDLLGEHLAALMAGNPVTTARYDFATGKSAPTGGREMRLGDREILLLEGIHGLNPRLVSALPAERVFRVFSCPLAQLPFDPLYRVHASDVRLIRRIVRDRHSRGTSAADNILRWPSVRDGERRHIFPFQHHADAVFDSSLIYELSVLRVYAERYLLEVPQNHPAYTTAFRLIRLLDRFVTIYPDHVPPTSILREFIGGSGFEY
jgi:uridine kinase